MNGAGLVILVVALTVLGLSLWGLFNRSRSILCALAGVTLFPGAILGARHAWGESRSLLWATGYLIAALLGLVSFFRQLKPRDPRTASTR
jgi:hypothetical protein